jgi:cobalt-zinc-cadmium efflux system protein
MKKENHSHMHNHSHSHNSTSNIKLAFFLNLAFTIIEIIGGYLTNSVAIIADALHDFGDSLSLGLSWGLDKYSKKKRTPRFSYGYKRFSLLAALINSIVLIVGSIFVLSEVIPRLMSPEPSNAIGMIFLAILGIIVNGIAVLRLKRGSSLNERVVSWHLLEDVLGWIAVLIVGVINVFVSVPILDPILALVFTLVILYNILKNLKQIALIFLQGIPPGLNISDVQDKIKSIKGVKSVHDTHIWSIDGEHNILTTHVIVDKDLSLSKLCNLKKEVRKISKSFDITHDTIEFETKDECCSLEGC